MPKNLKKILITGASLLMLASVGAGASSIKANAKVVNGVHVANNIPNSALRKGGKYHAQFEFDLAKLRQHRHHGRRYRRHSVKRHRTRKARRHVRKHNHKQIHKAKRNATKRSKSHKDFYFSNVWSTALRHNQKELKLVKKNHNYRLIKNVKRAIKHDKQMLKMSPRFSPEFQAKQQKLAAERDNAYENKVAAQTLAQER